MSTTTIRINLYEEKPISDKKSETGSNKKKISSEIIVLEQKD